MIFLQMQSGGGWVELARNEPFEGQKSEEDVDKLHNTRYLYCHGVTLLHVLVLLTDDTFGRCCCDDLGDLKGNTCASKQNFEDVETSED